MTPERHLLDLWRQLGETERTVLVLIAERLAMGQGQYGKLDLATDRRDMRREAMDEVADGLVYVACRLIQAPMQRRARPKFGFSWRRVGVGAMLAAVAVLVAICASGVQLM